MRDLWNNISKYPAFLAGITLGLLANALKGIVPLLKNPVTLIAVIGFTLGSIGFISFTLRAMLALDAP